MEEKPVTPIKGSTVSQNQLKLIKAMNEVLKAMFQDIRQGLLETVGVESSLSLENDRSSVCLDLPEGADLELIARAIDAENVEAWCDENDKVHIAVNPWYDTKDIDQTVLSTVKVIHVLLGIHATDKAQPANFKQKFLSSVLDVLAAQKKAGKTKNQP